MKNTLIICCVFLLASLVTFAQENQDKERAARIVTRDGKEYSGKIISEDSSKIIVEDGDVRITVLRTNITSIQYFSSVKSLDYRNHSFAFLGVTLLQPGGLNIVAGKDFGKLGLRVSAGFLREITGVQANFLFNISRSKSFNHHFSLGGGMLHGYFDLQNQYGKVGSERITFPYVGAFYDLNYGGVFLETGLLLTAEKKIPDPQLSLQLGYVYEFR